MRTAKTLALTVGTALCVKKVAKKSLFVAANVKNGLM